MRVRVWLKSRLADRVLSPVREALIRVIPHDSTLLEIGCGTGDLLFRAASKLKLATGVDMDESMIAFAEKKKNARAISHIHFVCQDALSLEAKPYDIASSTLCLHEMGNEPACRILDYMIKHSKKVLVADYAPAKTGIAKLGIEVDEMFSGHYRHFRSYRKAGGIPAYADRLGATVQDVIKTDVDGIDIWVIEGKFS